jgi:hypothetical protein
MLIARHKGVSTMPQSIEISIDLTAQDLLEPPVLEELTEFEDICAIDALQIPGDVANTAQSGIASGAADDAVEIELTPMEMDAMLKGTWQP